MKLVALLALAPALAHAAPRRMTLIEAKAEALATSPTLGRSKLVVLEASAALAALDASYDTQLAVDVTARRERAAPRRTPFTQQLSRDQTAVSAALARVFPHGGEAKLGIAIAREDSIVRVPSQLTHEDVAQRTIAPRIEASFRQPLWGGRDAGAATEAQLAMTRRATWFDAHEQQSTTLLEVTRTYWRLYLAQREVAIRGGARAAAEAQLRQAEAEIARGARARLAGIEIEDALARLREDELISIAAVDDASLELSRAIGIAPTTELRASDQPKNLEVPTSGTVDHAPARLAAEARIAVANAEHARAIDDSRWRIDAVIGGSLAAPRDTLRIALDDTAAYGGWTIEVGLSVRGPLTDRAALAKRDGARARVRAAELANQDLEHQLAADLARLGTRREVARKRRVALVRGIELAQQNLLAERNRWERGDTTAFELLRRQAALAETELRLERARVDELEADAGIAAITGVLR